MATLTRSAGAMLGSVAAAADAVSKTITAAASSVDMLELYINEALHNQRITSDQRMERVEHEAALEHAAFMDKVDTALEANPRIKSHYEKALADIKAKSEALKLSKDQ